MKIKLLFLFILSLNFCFGQHYESLGGARSVAIGNASVTSTDFWSLQNNQAGLGFLEQYALGVSYENRFLLKELSNKFVGLAIPTKTGTFGLSYQNFGYSMYSESIAGIAFGKSLGKNFSAGFRIDYLDKVFGEDYGRKSWITFELGIMYKLSEKLTLASHVFNPLQQKIAEEYQERLPSIFRFGLAYDFTESLIFHCEAEKNTLLPFNIKSGLEYHLNKSIVSRLGFNSAPAGLSFGFGLKMKSLQIDMASYYHQVLGFCPQVSLLYTIEK